MKKVRKLKDYTIVEFSPKDQLNHNVSSPYGCILNDEMEFASDLREIDMECGSVQECIDFIGC